MKQCRTVGVVFAFLVLTAVARAQETRVTTPVQAGKPLLGYSVVLVLGETQGAAAAEGLSAPARKALSDLKDFLPYKSYRVLDTQWIAATDVRALGMHADSGHLRGLDSQDYEFRISSQGLPGQEHNRGFSLRTAAFADDATKKAGPQTLVDTTLTIETGETVVVGTSRVQGDKALIVLLTAVPK
jgi:hypothetical protein